MALKSLEQTYIYNTLNKSNGLTNNISELLTKGKVLTSKELEEPFMIIMKNFKFPLKYKVMDAFNNKTLELRFATNTTKLPICLPFFLTKRNGGKIVAVVSVDLYGSYDEETESVKIDPKKLYTMMESAYLAIICYNNSKAVTTRPAIIGNGSSIYSMMFTRVLNKKYSLNIDKTKMHKVIFLSSKFYMINVLGIPNSDITFNYAIKNCKNGNLLTLKELDEMIPIEAYNDFGSFVQAISEVKYGLNLKDLTVRNYMEAFINMYEVSNLLSLESFPYFLYNVMSVTNGAYLNNQYVMEDIVGNMGAKMYNEIIKLTDM